MPGGGERVSRGTREAALLEQHPVPNHPLLLGSFAACFPSQSIALGWLAAWYVEHLCGAQTTAGAPKEAFSCVRSAYEGFWLQQEPLVKVIRAAGRGVAMSHSGFLSGSIYSCRHTPSIYLYSPSSEIGTSCSSTNYSFLSSNPSLTMSASRTPLEFLALTPLSSLDTFL